MRAKTGLRQNNLPGTSTYKLASPWLGARRPVEGQAHDEGTIDADRRLWGRHAWAQGAWGRRGSACPLNSEFFLAADNQLRGLANSFLRLSCLFLSAYFCSAFSCRPPPSKHAPGQPVSALRECCLLSTKAFFLLRSGHNKACAEAALPTDFDM